MTYNLRPYQQSMVDQTFQYFNSGVNSILEVLPTGGGKSVVFSTLVEHYFKQNEKILIIVHRQELVRQTIKHVRKIGVKSVDYIQGAHYTNWRSQVIVANIGSLYNRVLKGILERYGWIPTLTIIDETHHAKARTWQEVIEYLKEKGSKCAGFTATPIRMNGEGFQDIFDQIIIGAKPSYLFEKKYLSPFRVFAAPHADLTGIKSVAGDYKKSDLASRVDTSDLRGDVLRTWKELAIDKKTILFAVSPGHSKHLVDQFNEFGLRHYGRAIAGHIGSDGGYIDSDKNNPLNDREKITDLFSIPFHEGGLLILSNYGICTEGFDVPSCEVVQVVRPTQSLALHLQMLGRALRGAPGKTALILDHTENVATLGFPDEDHEWSLEGVKRKPKELTYSCPGCSTLNKGIPQDGDVCDVCGYTYIFDDLERIKAHQGEELPDIDKSVTLIEVVERKDKTPYEKLKEWVDKERAKGGVPRYGNLTKRFFKLNPDFDEIKQAGELLNYSSKWAILKYQEMILEQQAS